MKLFFQCFRTLLNQFITTFFQKLMMFMKMKMFELQLSKTELQVMNLFINLLLIFFQFIMSLEEMEDLSTRERWRCQRTRLFSLNTLTTLVQFELNRHDTSFIEV